MSLKTEVDLPPARGGRAVSTLIALAGLYLVTLGVGFVAFAALFKAGALNGMNVMFFRGLLLAIVAFIGIFGLTLAALSRWRPRGLSGRDAFGAAVLSLSFNISFLVVVPVTVDRSISIFVLGEMNAAPDRLYSPEDMSRLFNTIYVEKYRQIDRRLREQTIAGNVEAVGDKYRISARGRLSIAVAKRVVWLFGGDARLADPAGADAMARLDVK